MSEDPADTGSALPPTENSNEKIEIEVEVTKKGIKFMRLDKRKYKMVEQTVNVITYLILPDEKKENE